MLIKRKEVLSYADCIIVRKIVHMRLHRGTITRFSTQWSYSFVLRFLAMSFIMLNNLQGDNGYKLQRPEIVNEFFTP